MFAKQARVVVVVSLISGLSYHALRGQAAAPAKDGIYSADQAHRGQTLYQAQCTSCHGDALDGVGPYPPLAGDDFTTKYEGQPVLGLYDMIHKLMPATAPGSLSPKQSSDLVAYILSFNKFPAGPTELSSDEESLKKLTLPKLVPPKS